MTFDVLSTQFLHFKFREISFLTSDRVAGGRLTIVCDGWPNIYGSEGVVLSSGLQEALICHPLTFSFGEWSKTGFKDKNSPKSSLLIRLREVFIVNGDTNLLHPVCTSVTFKHSRLHWSQRWTFWEKSLNFSFCKFLFWNTLSCFGCNMLFHVTIRIFSQRTCLWE